MSILRAHLPIYIEALTQAGVMGDSVLVFGRHECNYRKRSLGWQIKRFVKPWLAMALHGTFKSLPRFRSVKDIPAAFQAESLNDICMNLGARTVRNLDWFDSRADIRHDMNEPIPAELFNAFDLVIDIGSTEHVFDAKQCLFNLLRMVKEGGHLFLHLPCNGYFGHGYYTFSPDLLKQVLTENGFEIVYLKYSSGDGVEVEDPYMLFATLAWIVAKKVVAKAKLSNPQQIGWENSYK